MRLQALTLECFRGYNGRTRIEFGDFTSIIGKNDVGKSTILEALEIFFNNESVKIDSQDGCVFGNRANVRIGCIFSELPSQITIDASAPTSLHSEYLLNEDGYLEIVKQYDCTRKAINPKIFARALHPAKVGFDTLLAMKNADLKARAKELGIDPKSVDQRSNVALRRSIWSRCDDLEISVRDISLDSEDGKRAWEQIAKELPIYALFQSDRSSRDDDDEVQDPLKLAVTEALREVQHKLDEIKEVVKEKTLDVARRTLDKLREMDADLASALTPTFKAEPKWDGFKLSLEGDDEIPINKRGSGVRRLVLLNFFRAEVERRQTQANASGVIFAVEEPENSQHPNNQIMLVKSLMALSEEESTQVIVTTHVPAIASLLPVESIRYVTRKAYGSPAIESCQQEILALISDDLGILPDRRVEVLMCVEGPNDVVFLENIIKVAIQIDPTLPDICLDPRVSLFPLGGGNLKHWVTRACPHF